jgi:hypothetical protein
MQPAVSELKAVASGIFGDMEMRIERVTVDTFRTALYDKKSGRLIFQGEVFALSPGGSISLPMAIKFKDA